MSIGAHTLSIPCVACLLQEEVLLAIAAKLTEQDGHGEELGANGLGIRLSFAIIAPTLNRGTAEKNVWRGKSG